MTTQSKRVAQSPAKALGLSSPLGENEQTAKLLMAAILAAGTPGKEEVALALLRKLGGVMTDAVLKEVQSD